MYFSGCPGRQPPPHERTSLTGSKKFHLDLILTIRARSKKVRINYFPIVWDE
jgi:hypothetical protein